MSAVWNQIKKLRKMFNLLVLFLLLSCCCIDAHLHYEEGSSTLDDQLLPAPSGAGDQTRNLQSYSVPCPGGGPLSYFRLDIQFKPQPSVDFTKCTLSLQKKIGIDLNALLLNYGIGAQGVGDNAVYLASVCTKPTTFPTRRRLQTIGFVWKGGGTCRQCPGDGRDARHLMRRLYDPNWFKNIYVPEMQNTLRNAITNTIVSKHPTCLGGGPQVLVTITEILQTQLKTGC